VATKWYQGTGDAKRKPVRCRACQDGFHNLGVSELRTCEGRACECFCRLPGVAPMSPASPMVLRPSLGGVLHKLRDAGVECRGTRMWTLVFRPRPATLPLPLRMAIRNYMPDLVRVLYPSLEVGRPHDRPYWTSDGLEPCFDCEKGTVSVDPLGQRRHSWCGWLSAPPQNQWTLDLTKGK